MVPSLMPALLGQLLEVLRVPHHSAYGKRTANKLLTFFIRLNLRKRVNFTNNSLQVLLLHLKLKVDWIALTTLKQRG